MLETKKKKTKKKCESNAEYFIGCTILKDVLDTKYTGLIVKKS